ncbi:P-loop containing nucleoside triphosphate hydrolase protein [Lophiotrema nucula]|uniref:P-loop containing nucleoside triphosphate hydrolase protein n=1 Tax=Lophiotrema nucula TaxID=690887 RepID=A0A6A5YI53_9PLEO|nr:P-loop containing nucleoside triphosphate hydrolase protein [Lophiotrema nucula]
MRLLNRCTISSQDHFGPSIDTKHCYGGFDFTLYFEETFLSIVPFTIVLPVLIVRLYKLHRAPIVVDGARWHFAKQAFYILYGAIQVLSLGATVMPDTVRTSATIASIVINLLATFVLAIVSNFEHYRSSRPSSPIGLYLVLTWIFDIARIRTLWATRDAKPVGAMLLVATLLKFGLVALELKEKRSMLLDPNEFRAPESTANFFNRLTFFWLNPLLLKGYSKPVQEHDLFEVQNQIVGEKELLMLAEKWEKSPHQKTPNSLFKLAFKHHWKSFASVILPRLCFTGFNFSQPFLLQRTLRYLTVDNYANRASIGNGLIVAYVFVYMGFGITNALHQHRNYRSVAKLRGSLIGIIYKKTLTMSSSALTESEAVTLMNADVERITVGLRQSQELWASFYEIPLSVWLLYQQISWAALTPLGVILGCTAAAIGASPKLASSQKTWLDKIQARVDATAAMLGSIKAVKMTGLTPDLGSRIRDLRETEINTARTFRGMLVKITTFSFASTSLSPVVALGTYILMAKNQGYPELNLERALTSLVLMNLLLEPVAFFITALSGLINTMSCLERIRSYLNTELKNETSFYKPRTSMRPGPNAALPNPSELTLPPISEEPLPSLSEKQAQFQEVDIDDGVTLASMSEKRDCIVAENASCGWDRSKMPILMNMNFRIPEGSLTMVVGPVSSGKSTLLKALLGETPAAKGLQRSFYTEVAYCSQSPWLVNGTLKENITHGSDLDPEWYNTVIQACDLETDIANMQQGDETIVGSKGLSLSGGQQQRVALARAIYFRRSIVMIDDVMSGLDASTEEHVFEAVLGEHGLLRGTDTTVVLVTNAVHRLSQADHIIALGIDGTITEQGSFSELFRQDGYVGNLQYGDRKEHHQAAEPKATIKGFKQSLVASREAEEIEKTSGAGDLTIYAYYIRTFGWFRWFLFCLFCALYGFGTAFPNVWVKWWATYNQEHPNEKIVYYLGLYMFFALLGLGSLVLACWTLIMTMTPHAGRQLHERLLTAVLNAPMSFFASTDTGITTNRFSQDLELIDMELPVALIRTAMMFFVLLAQLLVILASAKYVGIAMPATVAVIYVLQMYYLRTSRRLRILDIETKAYLGTQFLELLSGLITVRAFQWEYQHLSRFLDMLKKAQRPFYLLYCVQRWLNMVLDLIVGTIAIMLVVIAVKTKGSVDPGMTGLALTNLVGFSQMLKQLITNWTLLETSMGALARIRTFTAQVESENLPGEDQSVPDHWPKFGGIEFRNVVASHNKAKKATLNDLSFAIPPGTKLGLCGRSGSGKSSLISAILRLMDIQSGQIIIDGVDITTLPRQTVRSRLIALPQDPYVLAGTVRENVDPLGTVTDDEAIRAIRKVKLDHLLDDEDIGLNAKLSTDMLSQGQCQLLCLARAMIRKSSILILDEATASVDVHTDALMQEIIRDHFKHHTIIAAAHRLDTIIDFDAVLMLDAGKIVETDNPENLLTRDSAFKELYQIQKGESQPWMASTLSLLNDTSDRISLMSYRTGKPGHDM